MSSLLADLGTILASGCFAHGDYARLYLDKGYARPVALLHYLLRGERQGYRPCAFFDPAHYRRTLRTAPAEGNLFAAFLRSREVGSPCAEFDAGFYATRAPELAASGLTAWRHLLLHGMTELYDPAPDVSLGFVSEAYGVRPDRLHRMLMSLFRDRVGPDAAAFPLNRHDFDEARRRFREAIRLDLRRVLDAPRHRDLVFVQTAGRHDAAIEHGRAYDLMLNYYVPPAAEHAREADYLLVQPGTKTTAIATLLREAPDLLLRYDYVLFLDDDVEIGAGAIARLFDTMRAEGLDCAQPALTADSHSRYPELLARDGGGVRRLTALEIMMPALSRRALAECGWVFGEGISGYGVDLLLGEDVRRRFGETVAVVDGVLARHTATPDLQGGSFYRFLASRGINPLVELSLLRAAQDLPLTISPAPEP
ncbi:DUF707 domain-containing protein [Bosea sp. 117]|uniref:DUF707 domain-containing protein n=1 Tax=Bosea sp. 117 TaxID=1125973 RepID=UPI000494050E|nr:DUF707 domain-containing protein [Bosea sp. 117]